MEPLGESVSDVLRATGRKSPELGGGAASILSALIGLSLVRLAAATTNDRAEFDNLESLGRIDSLSARLEDLARADDAVFREYVVALKLPHETEREETVRDERLDETGTQAAETPLEAASLMVEVLELAARLAPHIGAEVASDIYAGAAILSGAFFGSIATLDINLKPRRMSGQRDALLAAKEEVLGRQRQAMSTLSRQAEHSGYLLS